MTLLKFLQSQSVAQRLFLLRHKNDVTLLLALKMRALFDFSRKNSIFLVRKNVEPAFELAKMVLVINYNLEYGKLR